MRLVVASVSTPQRACGSAARNVSTIASEMRSQTLSGCPSDTDSLVKTKSCFGNGQSPLYAWAFEPRIQAGGRRQQAVDPALRCRIDGAEASSPILPSAASRRYRRGRLFAARRRFRRRALSRDRAGAGEPPRPRSRNRPGRVRPSPLSQRVGFEGFGRRLGKAAHRRRAHRVGIVEKERYRHVQHPAQLVQPARPDPVRAALVFLHLLKGQPDRLAELFLAEAEHVAAQPQPRPDPDIDRVRCFSFRTARPPGRLRSCHFRS